MKEKRPVYINGRMTAGEEMIWSPELKSLRRGRRSAARTEVCRPCLVWIDGEPEHKIQGVLLDLNKHGMRIRLMDTLPAGAVVGVQMMRDEDFQVPLSPPICAKVVRTQSGFGGLIDHGLKLIMKPIKRPAPKPVSIVVRRPRRTARTRMHTLDLTVGDQVSGRIGRRRG